jgi:hypothetical protein
MGAIHETTMDDAIALAIILEEISSDHSIIYPVNSETSRVPVGNKAIVENKSDHLALLNAFRRARDLSSNSAQFYNETGMSHAFWSRIVQRVNGDKTSSAKTVVRDVCSAYRADPSVAVWRELVNVDTLTADYVDHNGGDRQLMATVLQARMHHVFEVVQEGPSNKHQRPTRAAARDSSNKYKLAFSDTAFKLTAQSVISNFPGKPAPRGMLPTSGIAEHLVTSTESNDAEIKAYIISPFPDAVRDLYCKYMKQLDEVMAKALQSRSRRKVKVG